MSHEDLFDLTGVVSLVTGASSGIGQSIAITLAKAGSPVVLAARRLDRLTETVDLIEKLPGRAHAIAVDLDDESEVNRLSSEAASAFGSPLIVFNCAGINLREPYDEITTESFSRTLNINLAVPFFLSQALIDGMKSAGWGRIINIASLQSRRAFPDSIAYGASKGGVEQLTRAMSEAWSRYGVNCNAIGPGFFETELTQAVFSDPERRQWAAAQTTIGRNGTLEDLDGVVIFLASHASDYITGQTIYVDGGFTAR
ncbi:MAG: short-chain dehydrogenase [marine bacterium B5-7]|nr:MAG: short-chain dehydrogenase [marine bacterium B5-7]